MAKTRCVPTASGGSALPRLSAAMFAAFALLSLPVPAASPPAGAFTTRVRFINDTPYRRVQWSTATVPFPIGVWTPGKSFAAVGLPSDVVPFGARWPDGSVRFAQLTVKLDLAPGEEKLVDVTESPSTTGAFNLSSWVVRGLSTFDMRVVATLSGGKITQAPLRFVSAQPDGGAQIVAHSQAVLPGTDMVYDAWFRLFDDQDHIPFELRVTNSSAGSTAWEGDFESLDLWVSGAAAAIYGINRRGASYGPVSPNGPNHIHLMDQDSLWDGQGQEWVGTLLFDHPTGQPGDPVRIATLSGALLEPLFGVSTDWASSGAFGPFGYVPPPPPWVKDGGRACQIAEKSAFDWWVAQPGTPWDDWPLGLRWSPGLTGDQYDFGAAKILDVFATGLPYGIEEARLNASEEALRPVHHREAGGTRVQSDQHPLWVTWDGRTHYNTSVSPDRLGKPSPAPTAQSHMWAGRDDEHWSSLTFASAYLLTKSPALRYELDNEAELYIAGHTLPSTKPGWSTNAIGASRAIGRTSLSMAWNYLCTGRTDLCDHLAARIREVVGQQAVMQTVTGPVRPIVTQAPDARFLLRTMWRPWEEAQAVMGLEAAYRVTGEPEARRVAAIAAKTLLDWGWKLTSTETIIASAIGWKANGQPLTTQEYNDPTWVLWSYGTSFSEWAVPSVKLAGLYGALYGDPALAIKAAYVYGQLFNSRQAPSNGGWDRFSEWDAVR